VIEELFWRGWLMRYAISPRFETIRLGTYSAFSFWITAVLFASEHGSFWEVGLVAGIIYNWWMLRTHSLGDCITAHAVTNACLAAYVIAGGQWQYWL
jgi:CAAX prenyl protease-like protein